MDDYVPDTLEEMDNYPYPTDVVDFEPPESKLSNADNSPAIEETALKQPEAVEPLTNPKSILTKTQETAITIPEPSNNEADTAIQVSPQQKAKPVNAEREYSPSAHYKNVPGNKQMFQFNLPKMIILIGGISLSVLSIIALNISQVPEPFFKPVHQFEGEIQFEEMDDEVMVWDNDYSDINSEKSRAVVEKVKEKLAASLAHQGISVDSITITGLVPSDTKTIIKNTVASEDFIKARMSDPSQTSLSVYYNEDPQRLLRSNVRQEKYENINTINVQYSTSGKPYKNAALFGSAAGKWQELQENLEDDLQKSGVRAHFDKLKPTNDYLYVMADGIKKHPDKITPIEVEKSKLEKLGCEYTGVNLLDKNIHAECVSGCSGSEGGEIVGGKDGKFAYQTGICAAAHYMGIISDTGGFLEVLSLGVGQVEKGADKEGFFVIPAPAEFPMFKLKNQGEDKIVPPGSSRMGMTVRQGSLKHCKNPVVSVQVLWLKFEGKKISTDDIFGKLGGPVFNQELIRKMQDTVIATFKKIGLKELKCALVTYATPHPPFHVENGVFVSFHMLGTAKARKQLLGFGPTNVAAKFDKQTTEENKFSLEAIRFDLQTEEEFRKILP